MVSGYGDRPQWRVYTRTKDLSLAGQLDTFTRLSVTLRHNGPGSWSATLPADHRQASVLQPGAGILLYSDWSEEPIFNGPVVSLGNRKGDGELSSVITATGIDDLALLADRLAYAKPSAALPDLVAGEIDPDSPDEYDIRTGQAETIIRQYVNLNAGPGALAARRIAGLVMEPDQGRGIPVTGKARFDQLLDFIAPLARTAGLGVQIVQTGMTRTVRFYVPQNRTGAVRMSPEIGNLRGWEHTISAPTATRAIVAGDGVGIERRIGELSTATTAEADWDRRIEVFVDSRDTDADELLITRGDDKLKDSDGTAAMTLSPVDSPTMRFGQDYYLGDVVTGIVSGVPIQDVVTEVTITIDKNSAVVTPTIGPVDKTTKTPLLYSQVREVQRRVGRLERRQ